MVLDIPLGDIDQIAESELLDQLNFYSDGSSCHGISTVGIMQTSTLKLECWMYKVTSVLHYCVHQVWKGHKATQGAGQGLSTSLWREGQSFSHSLSLCISQ